MIRTTLCLLFLLGGAARADEAATVEEMDMIGACMGPPAVSERAEADLDPDPEHGAWYYKQACALCHGPVILVRERIQGDTEAEREAWLADYLMRHHCANDAALRADLIAYLLQE